MRYDGTRGTIRARFGTRSQIDYHDHATDGRSRLPIPPARSGHGGGDWGVLRAFAAAVQGDPSSASTAREVLESHLLALAAEQSRLTGRPVAMDQYRLGV